MAINKVTCFEYKGEIYRTEAEATYHQNVDSFRDFLKSCGLGADLWDAERLTKEMIKNHTRYMEFLSQMVGK